MYFFAEQVGAEYASLVLVRQEVLLPAKETTSILNNHVHPKLWPSFSSSIADMDFTPHRKVAAQIGLQINSDFCCRLPMASPEVSKKPNFFFLLATSG